MVREARGGVRDAEWVGVRVSGLAREDPVVLGHKGHALALALNHQGKRGRLNTAGRARVAQTAKTHAGKVAREHGAPDEVDVLAALARVCKVLVERHQVIEGVIYLGLGEGGVACARDIHVWRHREDLLERIRANELALAVEVRADNDRVRLLGKVLERADDLLLGWKLLDGSPHQIRQARDLPTLDVHAVGQEGLALGGKGRTSKAIGHVCRQVLALGSEAVPALLRVKLELWREVRLHDVAAQAYGHPVLPALPKAVDGRVVDLVRLGLAGLGEEPGDLLGGIVLLGDDKDQRTLPRLLRDGRVPLV